MKINFLFFLFFIFFSITQVMAQQNYFKPSSNITVNFFTSDNSFSKPNDLHKPNEMLAFKNYQRVTILLVNSYFSNTHKDTVNKSFEKEKSIITIGYGVINIIPESVKDPLGNGILNIGPNPPALLLGPMQVKYEYTLSNKIGVGLIAEYLNSNKNIKNYRFDGYGNTVYYNYGVKVSQFLVATRLNFHFYTNTKVDYYFGIGIGYQNNSYAYYYNDPILILKDPTVYNYTIYNSPISFETTLGLRYYFTENIGVYLEIGFARSVIQGGFIVEI